MWKSTLNLFLRSVAQFHFAKAVVPAGMYKTMHSSNGRPISSGRSASLGTDAPPLWKPRVEQEVGHLGTVQFPSLVAAELNAMKLKRTITSLLLAVFLLMPLPTARAVFQGQASLVVAIQPMAYVAAPSSIVWDNAGNVPAPQLPLDIKVRLNRGAHADLSISRMDQTLTNSGPDANLQPRLEVETASGISELSAAPVVLRQFSRSGVYHHSVVVRVSSAVVGGGGIIPMRVRLSLSDGSAEWSVPVTLQWKAP